MTEKALCLNMIVKNEMANLERCLAAVAPYIACWVIGDTGSTDGTQEFIRSFFSARGIPGELHRFPFVDFAQARNEALDRARVSELPFDYLLLTDADMELMVQNPAFSQDLTFAAYKVLQRSAVTYWNNRLLRRDVSASYKGVTHEFLDVRAGETKNLEGISFIDHGTGSNRVDKCERDVRLLTDAIATERDPGMIARYTFYLANTLRDGGQKEAALDTYLKRARLGNWQQEVFMSLLNAAKLNESLQRPNDEVISAYKEATSACPTRAEALHGAARFCREKGSYERGYEFASQGLRIAYPKEALFVQDWVYEYGLLDELAITAYWTGRYQKCVDACDRLLNEGKLPADKRDRVLENKNFALDKQQDAGLSSPKTGNYLKLLREARQKEELARPEDEVVAAYLEATAACPTRAEALHGGARFCRNQGLYQRGYELAAKGRAIPYPKGAPAVEDWIYNYGLLDELAVNAYWTGRYQECVDACDRLLNEVKLPADIRDRVLKNKNLVLGKQQELAISKQKQTAAKHDVEAPSADAAHYLDLLSAARQKEVLGCPNDEVIAAYMAATAACATRAEAMHGAARFCRLKSLPQQGSEFAARGLAIACPKDVPAVEKWIYEYGLQQEFSITANYTRDPAVKERGFAACNWLVLNRKIPEEPRNLANSNLHFYLGPAVKMMPSFAARPVGFAPPNGYRPTNPSVARHGDAIVLVQRAVNYTIDHTAPNGGDRRYGTPNGEPIHTRNFLLRLEDDLNIRSASEILPPADMPEPSWTLAQGFEDLRPFAWRDALWCIACVRQLSKEGWCEQVLARIDQRPAGASQIAGWRVLRPEGSQRHEKNWMPCVDGDALRFVYLCDPTRVVDDQARAVAETVPPIEADQFRGGSQLISFNGGWLALVHETRVRDKQRHYRHRFVWFDEGARLRGVSRPFFFQKRGVEFAAGLAWHPDGKRLVVTYGVDGSEAWIATIDADDVRRVLQDAERLPSAPGSDTSRPVTPVRMRQGGSPQEKFFSLAPFLRAADSPKERREQSRSFDARIAPLLSCSDGASLPQIHCFYEVISDKADHRALIAATASMRAAGHPVRVWSYSPQKLGFLRLHGIELRPADDVMPPDLFKRIVAGSSIRYFSDIFRYAVLYEHGGLWMDSDVVLLRPFPFRGDHFFNLQWRSGPRKEHFICGNVLYARAQSHHIRNLYEISIDRFFAAPERMFGDIGPKLLSHYIASDAGAELRDRVFSPMFFNPIDWTEINRFDQPLAELKDYLCDDRVFGIHLWTARNDSRPRSGEMSLSSLLSDPLAGFPSFTNAADRFHTDKNRHTGNRHCYARVYDRLLSSRRFSMRRLMEIRQTRGQTDVPWVALWQSCFPFCQVIGVDLTDFSKLHDERFTSFVCDQSKSDELRTISGKLEQGSLDVIIDDGSHASYGQQLTLREFWPLLAEGGWYFIEDLDWQPPGEDTGNITLTKSLLREIKEHGVARSIDPLGVSELSGQIAEILFFDSHYELQRARLLGGLVAVRKRGGSGLVR